MSDQAEAVDLQAGSPRKRVDGPADRARAVKESKRKTILPKPKGLSVKPDVLFKWGESFNAEQNGRAVWHVYRDWPVINLELVGKQKPKLIVQLGPLPFAAAEWESYFLRNQEWGGSGSYKVICTETGLPGCISMSKFTIEDGDYPPIVDPKSLVVGHPDNAGFITGLRSKGIRIPGDDPEADRTQREEEEEMNIATPLLESQIRQNERLVGKLEETQDELRDLKRNDGPSTESVATNQAVKVIAEGAKAAIDMVSEQHRTMSQAQAPAFNPLDVAKFIVDSRGGDSGLAIAKMFVDHSEKQMEAVRAMQHETIEFLSKRDEEETPAPAAAIERSDESPRKSLMQEMKDTIEFAELLGFKRAGAAADNPAPKEAGWFDKVMNAIVSNPPIMITGGMILANLVYNLRADKPQDPKEALAKAAALTGGTVPAATPTPAPASGPDPNYIAFMEMLTPHFLLHYSGRDRDGNELNGFTLAEDLHTMTPSNQLITGGPRTPQGRENYESIFKAGQVRFDQALRQWPAIWNSISNNPHGPTDPARYSKFLQEFFSYDQWSSQHSPKVTPMRPS
jgi:hypothetical protein